MLQKFLRSTLQLQQYQPNVSAEIPRIGGWPPSVDGTSISAHPAEAGDTSRSLSLLRRVLVSASVYIEVSDQFHATAT